MATIPAMHQYWSLIWFVLCSDPPEIVEDGSSILWHTMIRPGGEVILDHLTRAATLSSVLHKMSFNMPFSNCSIQFICVTLSCKARSLLTTN